MQVQVVSGVKEHINVSPGSVSTFYPEQLQRMGMHSLSDFLSFAPSTEVAHAVQGIQIVQIRGLSDSFNQKVLLMIDGIPYWMPSHGDLPMNGIPLAAIHKIEVIRGPASVKYGTNSSAGVINVITHQKAHPDIPKNSNVFLHQNENSATTAGIHWSESTSKARLALSLEAQRDQGFDANTKNTFESFDPSCNCFPLAGKESYERRREYTVFLGQLQYSGLSLTLQQFEDLQTGLLNGSLESPSDVMKEGQLVSAHYQFNWKATDVNFKSDWNRFSFHQEADGILSSFGIPGDGRIDFDNDGDGNIRWLNGIELRHQATEELVILAGAEHEQRATENYKYRDNENGQVLIQVSQPPFNQPFEYQDDGSILLIEEDDVTEQSVFFQGEYQLSNWRYVAGLRYVENTDFGSHTAPRASAVWSLSERDSIKFLYGEGFNSPTFRQTSARNQFGFAQDIDIGAETVRTFEIAYAYTRENLFYALTAYQTEVEDLISVTNAAIVNLDDKIVRQGLEYEFNWRLGELNMLGSLSYLHQGNTQIDDDSSALFGAKWLGKFGAEYQINKHSLGTSLRSASKRAEADEYYWLNLIYGYDLEALSLFVSVNNVLSDDLYQPDVRNQNDILHQGADKADVTLGLRLDF